MSSYTSLAYHAIFSTKYRHPSIGEDFRKRLHEYIGGIIRNKKGSPIEINGVADHVHLLAQFPASIAVSEVLRDIKANSSGWINDLGVVRGRFEWQVGFAAFTVSFSNIPSVREYIVNQEEHHRVHTFEEEYIAFLDRHEIEYERRYVFEKEFAG